MIVTNEGSIRVVQRQRRYTFKEQTRVCAFVGVMLLMGAKVLINATGECVTRSDICRLMHAGGLTMGIFGGVGIYLGIWGLFVAGREPLYYYTRS